MLRLLMVVSGAFEALFGLSALIAPDMLVASLGTEPNAASIPCSHSWRRDFGVGDGGASRAQ